MPAFFILTGAMGMAACQWLIYIYAPQEATMGIIQKIFYVHMPLAFWALISFFVVFAGSLAYLFNRRQTCDNLCAAAAEIGLLFCGLSLLTGMIWAKKSWGVWWTWDPRLTTTLIMWFIYSAYLLIRGLDMPPERRNIICAVVGIAAFVDVPLVFLSARIFRSIHPAVFASPGGGLPVEMKIAVLCSLAALGFFWLGLLLFRKGQLNLQTAIDEAIWNISQKDNQS